MNKNQMRLLYLTFQPLLYVQQQGKCCLQAKVSELEQKVAEQQRAMTVLLQDKATLESRVNIFVRVLQMRDEQIEQIRSGQRVRSHR